ncbi:hypothetical protein Rhow_006939 [Rhodococcus wratislaviensis]|uniref:Uncharacterized protein n=1 Tax=Rhodococcus wratislaviensis TaxID=44752 RepID=A0A402CGT7_RHOWR|nr:hypothetical protein Rhow_006939 [Rhodococcus wratislaviensis]
MAPSIPRARGQRVWTSDFGACAATTPESAMTTRAETAMNSM